MSDQDRRRARQNRASSAWRWLRLLLVTVTAAVLFLAACGPTQPTQAPTAIAATEVSTAENPTATRVAESTATPVPTRTSLPTHTPTSTHTPLAPTGTATPVPTDTPRPTSTQPQPTDTPMQPTDTPSSTATKAPPPTQTAPPPPQFPWRGQVVGTFSNCALTRVMGLTLDRNGGIAGDIWVHWWAESWDGAWGRSTWGVNEGLPGLDDSSNWDGILDTYPKAGTWYVCVVPAEGSKDCISTTVTAETTADPCAPESGGVQIVRIVFQQN
jgi:hypothetical protein